MAGTAIATGVGVGVGMGAAYGGLTDILRTGINWAKWKAVGRSMGYPLMADVLQKLISAEKDEVHGLSSKGMIDAVWSFIDRTLDFSWMVSEGIANQLFVQMIQQSIAYAIHSSHAGSIGTVCNVYSGSASLSGMSASQIGENVDLADRAVKGFLSASVGLNVPTLAFELTRGVNTRIQNIYGRIITQADSFLDEWNDLALGYYRHYNTMARNRLQDSLEMRESVVTRAYGLLEQVANEHLARVSEQLDTLEGCKAWFDSGLTSADELTQVALRVNIEREASENNFDDYKDEILSGIEVALGDWNGKVEQALSDMKECEYRYNLLIKDIFSTLFADVHEFVQILCDEIDKTVEDVCAYRNIKQAVKVEQVTALGEVESSPETEIFRIMIGRWTQIPNITRAYAYSRIRGKAWQEDEEHDKGIIPPAEAYILPRKKWEEVDVPLIRHHTQPTPLVPWESVG